ncbi:heavy metal efflux pump, cobalt-zinc-cadmium [Mizugakiibacter sediminis]|uniref:Heavy metal efflux pump, cobalt-zinc-cadmium n=1 Tax=Mizugakiibacter sediminis TaxID=1475481 RepID=A0A0K8QRQ0_9GAMM|nr:hypothetical protein [Mizugakiibacter sediminis]GAP67336.1 heavy metal efflux pump, cobalt-zinc-cadmium [Mizugakiibacter sediminis]
MIEHNILAGMLLVTAALVFFLFDLRAGLIVALTIPLALLFAFVCIRDRRDFISTEAAPDSASNYWEREPGLVPLGSLRRCRMTSSADTSHARMVVLVHPDQRVHRRVMRCDARGYCFPSICWRP